MIYLPPPPLVGPVLVNRNPAPLTSVERSLSRSWTEESAKEWRKAGWRELTRVDGVPVLLRDNPEWNARFDLVDALLADGASGEVRPFGQLPAEGRKMLAGWLEGGTPGWKPSDASSYAVTVAPSYVFSSGGREITVTVPIAPGRKQKKLLTDSPIVSVSPSNTAKLAEKEEESDRWSLHFGQNSFDLNRARLISKASELLAVEDETADKRQSEARSTALKAYAAANGKNEWIDTSEGVGFGSLPPALQESFKEVLKSQPWQGFATANDGARWLAGAKIVRRSAAVTVHVAMPSAPGKPGMLNGVQL